MDVSTDELFAGKRVVVFSLPGAFTPTCSSSHLPRYNELAPVFKKLGIDADIYHTNVGDAKSQANNYDVVFCSDSLVGNFGGSKATVIGLKNLLSEAEMTEKIQAAGLK